MGENSIAMRLGDMAEEAELALDGAEAEKGREGVEAMLTSPGEKTR